MLVITGMHRSGTSLVARLFHLAGADLGDPGSFHPGDRWNPEGYFEQLEVLAINRALVHGPWGKLAYFHLPSTRTILKRAATRGERLRRAASDYQGLVVKDTRFCLTLPAWLAHGARVAGVLICLREPIEVARSLSRRNRITVARGLRLWVTHCQRVLENVEGQRLGFVLYHNLLSAEGFLREMRRAFLFAGLDLTGDQIRDLGRRAVRSPAHRAPHALQDYPGDVGTLWHTLLERHAAQADAPVSSPPMQVHQP